MTPAPRTRTGQNVMALRLHGQAPSDREKEAASMLARQVAALLQPVLAQMDRKLDSLIEKTGELNAVLARLDTRIGSDLPARQQARPGAVPRDGASVQEGAGGQCQER
jgi:hypothetical protein